MANDRNSPPPSPNRETSEEPTASSPIKPLLWILIPFVLVMAYGILAGN